MKTLCSLLLLLAFALFLKTNTVNAHPVGAAFGPAACKVACKTAAAEVIALAAPSAEVADADGPLSLAATQAATVSALEQGFEVRDAAIAQWKAFLDTALSARYVWVWMFVILLAVKCL